MTLGRYGNTGWGVAWIAALERLSTAWQSRLPRGQDYASKGHVLSVQVAQGRIAAKVQGSRSKPYSTTIELPVFREAEWDRLLRLLADQAYYPAYLLAGVVPPGIDEAFRVVGLSLFPQRNSEMLGSCSCPDKSRPCKHIAAVHYSFAEALESDPFLVWSLRGMDKRAVGRAFRRIWFGEAVAAAAEQLKDPNSPEGRGVQVLSLSADRFNRAPTAIESISFHVQPSESPLFILNRLGQPPSWRLPVEVETLFGPVYEEAVKLAVELALQIDTFSAEAEGDDEDGANDDALIDEDLDDEGDDDEGDEGDDGGDDEAEEVETPEAEEADELPPARPGDEDPSESEDGDFEAVPDAVSPSGRFRALAPAPQVARAGAPPPPPPAWRASQQAIAAAPPPPRPPATPPKPAASLPKLTPKPAGRESQAPAPAATPARAEPAVMIRKGAAPIKAGFSRRSEPAGPAIVRRGDAIGSPESRIARSLVIGEFRPAFDAAAMALRGALTEERLALLLESAERAQVLDLVGAQVDLALASLVDRGDPAEPALMGALLIGGRYATAASLMNSLGGDAWQGDPSMAGLFVTFATCCASGRTPQLVSRPAPDIEAIWRRQLRVGADMGKPPRTWGHWFEVSAHHHRIGGAEADELTTAATVAVATLARGERGSARIRTLVQSVADLARARGDDSSAHSVYAMAGLAVPDGPAPRTEGAVAPLRRARR